MDDTDNNEIQLHTENSPLISTPAQVGDDEEKGKNNTLDNNDTSSILEDIIDTFYLAVPIFISRVSYVGMKTTDTALLGHVSGHALSAAALSDLYTMCTGVLIQGRVLGIIVGQAIGAGSQQLALVYLRISFLILGVLSIFVMISWSFTEQIWIWLGQDSDIAKDAGYYSMIFILSIPPRLGFSQLSQYLSAQRIMKPEVYTSLIALLCNLILGFVLVLGIPFGNGYGFKACPMVTVVVIWCQCIILFSYWLKSGDNTASDSSAPSQVPYSPTKPSQWISTWTEQITMERIRTYTHLYFPAALAISSDFWRMGVIGAIAARLGETEVGLFNASYRILWITLIFIGSLSGASGIKIALRLGKGKALKARQAAAVGLALQLLFLLTLSLIVFYNIRMFGQLFTNDESYLNLF